MPKDFMDCVKNKGRVVTKSLKGNKYIKICYGKDGKSYTGEVKLRKKDNAVKNNKINKEKDYIRRAKAQATDLLKLKEHFDKNNRN